MHLSAIFVATILSLILQPLPQGAVVLLFCNIVLALVARDGGPQRPTR